MSKPFAICIENLNAPPKASRYLRCVALPGRQPGLRLDKTGQVHWQREDVMACELWVSTDQRLILYRQEGMAPVTLHRAGRSLDVPCSKPVVLVDQDQIEIGLQRLRIHIHGEAAVVAAPSPLPVCASTFKRLAQAAVTATLVGAAFTAEGCKTVEVRYDPPAEEEVEMPTPTIEVRDFPPATEEVEMPTPTISENLQGEWIAAQAYDLAGEQTWITGTLTLVHKVYTFKPASEISGTPVDETLNFLFDHPWGMIEITYPPEVNPDQDIADFSPGDTLATIVFRANGEVVAEFTIRMRDLNSLELITPSGASDLWSVIKQIK